MLWKYGYLLLISTTYTFSQDYDENYGVSEGEKNVFYPRYGQVCELISTKKEVKNLVVPISGYTAESFRDLNSHPPIYFNLHKNGKNFGQYVLINKTLHKINDGRDSTADYPPDQTGEDINKNIYIGAADGIYVYDPDTRAVEKYGDINEDIIAIEKVTGKDEIYILNANHKIYKITQGGNVKTPVQAIDYARDFTLDLDGGIFYIDRDNKPRYLAVDAKTDFLYTGVGDEFRSYIISRAMWSQHDGVNHIIPYIADGVSLHFARGNLTWVNHDVNVINGLTAFNAELLAINYYGVNGKIYEHNLILESETSYTVRAGARKKLVNRTHQPLKAFDQDVKANYDSVKKIITN